MFDYDCVVAFDPNWQALSAGQLELLEKWVGQQGGGLIVVAGAVYAGKGVGGWTQDPAMTPDPQSLPRRVSQPAGGYGKQHLRQQGALAVGLHPRRTRGRFPLAGRHGHGQPAGLGRFSRRL